MAIDKARAITGRRGVSVTWIVEDILDFRPAREGYDLVLLAYIHLPSTEMARLFTKLPLAVAPGGTLFVVGHDRTNIHDGYGGPSDPNVLYDASTITSHLNGFTVQHAGSVIRPVETSTGER